MNNKVSVKKYKGDKLDSVGSSVRYNLIKLCPGSVYDTMRR